MKRRRRRWEKCRCLLEKGINPKKKQKKTKGERERERKIKLVRKSWKRSVDFPPRVLQVTFLAVYPQVGCRSARVLRE